MAGASMSEQTQTMEKPAELQPEVKTEPTVKRDGPFWLAIAIAVGGAAYLLLGSLTIVPWISDERESATVRSVWLALSRNLPDIGQPTLEKVGFWLLIAMAAALCVALMIAASAVREDDEQDSGKLA
jgi:hypothetical protein